VRLVVQRVARASVSVGGELVGEIGPGLLLLCGIGHDDHAASVEAAAGKVARLRIFPDAAGDMNRSVIDAGGAVLAVSQFTLLADTSRGNRPGFSGAAPPAVAEPLYERFVARLRDLGLPVATGRFGARMAVELVNDGPVTIVL
jgi:D-tyrosyl-tRNA(Tyr) deacylase